ncbi:hypothetical protein R5W24_004760 [Gemmata sp. JC717]|uniref:hypothetical protein n=1 Tax=Gemmata algarum TaxID=2975278 RepID=UPI0021BB899E|nr:hypothetical protein [Gemmata algarum]MDY3555615.1 hypothetical protein [Gemmata algarum]
MALIELRDADTELTLPGFVGLSEWSALAAVVRRRLQAHPDARVTLDCGRVAGIAPDVFLAIGTLLRSDPGRVRLRNAPAVMNVCASKLVVSHVLDGLVLTVSRSVGRLSAVARDEELTRALGRLTASVSALKRAWLGAGASSEAGVPTPSSAERPAGATGGACRSPDCSG